MISWVTPTGTGGSTGGGGWDDSSDPYNGHDYVDLGLPSGLKWATCNVGATNPEDFGDYFAWGETEPYYTEGHAQDNPCTNWKAGKTAGYDWPSYKWHNGSDNPFTKYCVDSSHGTVDNKTVLDPEDDAARQNWGGLWRMPTLSEFQELENNCTWEWSRQNTVYGYKITGSNDNWIFLPGARRRSDRIINGSVNSYGNYWSSTLSSIFAYDLYFTPTGYINPITYGTRCDGMSVRPVIK